jgi:cytochrome c oxidase subunit 4
MEAGVEDSKTVQSKTLLRVWVSLLALTGITLWVARVDLGFLNVVAALTIATAKASLVVLFFMDLRHEGRLFRNMLLVTLLVLAIFLGFTFFDIVYRP